MRSSSSGWASSSHLRPWESAIFIAIVVASLAIALGVHHPPMQDLPHHLSTGVIARALLSGDPFYAAHYRFEATPLPYWTVTALFVPLISLLGQALAVKVMVSLYLVGLPLSYWLLLRVAAPRNAAMALVGALTVFNWAYWLGEMNFLFGQPLMLLAFAAFLRVRRIGSLAFAGFVVATTLAYFSHIFAVVGLLAAIGPLALRDLLAIRRPSWAPWRFAAAQWVAVGYASLAFLAGAYYVLFHHAGGTGGGHMVLDWSRHRLLLVAANPLRTLAAPTHYLKPAFLIAVLAIAALPGLAAVRRGGRLADLVEPTLFLPAIAFFVLSYLGPAGIQEQWQFEDIGDRFHLLCVLFALGSIKMSPSPRTRLALGACVVAFATFKLSDAWVVHRDYEKRAARISDDLLARIPEHSRVLPLFDVPDASSREHMFVHYSVYVVTERSSYNPHVWARTGQQALRHVRWGEQRPVADLEIRDEEWAYYDYVIVQTGRDPPVAGLAAHTEPVADAGGFRLYRVRAGSGAPASGSND